MFLLFLYCSPKSFVRIFLALLIIASGVSCWDNEELEIFDVVEEINENFYTVMGISQDATLTDVKKAYRSLSKVLHPDKSDAPDAEVKFRQLVSIYEILRDDKRRARYNQVLVEGLPDWRSPIYYYRRARKMSLLEIAIILTVVISVTQYLMAWGSYLDKRHTLEEFLLRKLKIKDKKKKRVEDQENMIIMEQELNSLPRPSWWNILPVQLVQLVIFLVRDGPSVIKSIMKAAKEEKQRIEQIKMEELEEQQRIKEEEERKKERKAQMKTRKRVNLLPDFSDGGCILDPGDRPAEESIKPVKVVEPIVIGGPWLDEDFSELTRLMAKFPGGTFDRWEKIGEQMNRTVFEVTTMSKRVKAELINRNIAVPSDQPPSIDVKLKPKTKGGNGGDGEVIDLGSDEHWSATQQKVLEKALKLYPKGTDQRWDKISNNVPDKSKGECMLRFKFLAEKIRKKKEEEERPAEGEDCEEGCSSTTVADT